MDGKMKIIMGVALILGLVTIAFLAVPIQAYVNGTDNGDSLQTQDQDRLRIQDCDCNCDCAQTQHRHIQRINECATNRICNCEMNMGQYENQTNK